MKKHLVVVLIFAAKVIFAQSQVMEHRINSTFLDSERKIWVSLPKFYEENNDKCHTLYIFDADVSQTARTIRAIRDELFETGRAIPPLIIVGIEQIERSKELHPYGKAGANFLKYIEKEVVPLVDSMYQTIPNRIISGHSMGGHFALYTWMKSDLFNSCFAFSPAIYSQENQISKDLKQYLEKEKPIGSVYVNHGTEGRTEKEILKHIDQLNEVFNAYQSLDFDYQYKVYEGYGHNFTPIPGIGDGLLFHFSGWSMDNDLVKKMWAKEIKAIEGFELFYEKLDQKYGFKVPRDNGVLTNLASEYANTGHHEEALKIIDYSIALYPKDAFAYMTKGEILMEKDKEAAKAFFIKALLYLNPSDVFECTKNFKEYEFWKEILEENLKSLEE